jgi:hypothetical protein
MRVRLFALALLAFASPAAAQYLPVGTDSGATNQVAVTTSATAIVSSRVGAPRVGRVAITITNITGSGQLCIGFTNAVTTGTGLCLPAVAGAAVTLNTTAALWGIATVATQTISYAETF